MTATPYHDPAAELIVVGCAVDNAWGSRLAHQRLTADDFYDPALARLFHVTPDLPTVAPDHQADPWQPLLWQQRARQAAVLAEVPEQQVHALLQIRTVLVDESGRYARRVARASEARRRRAQLAAALELLDAGDLDRSATVIADLAPREVA